MCPEIPLFPTCSRVVRKSIARVLTVINQTQKENLRKFYKVRTNIFQISSCCSQLQSLWEGTEFVDCYLKLNEEHSFMFSFKVLWSWLLFKCYCTNSVSLV